MYFSNTEQDHLDHLCYVLQRLREYKLYAKPREYHDVAISGHFGWKKVKYAISQWFYYWPTLEGDVKAYVRACPHCQLYKPTVQPKT